MYASLQSIGSQRVGHDSSDWARMLTYNIDVGIGKDSAMDIWSFTLVHSGVIWLYVGKTDFPGRDDIARIWISYKRWKNVSLIKSRTWNIYMPFIKRVIQYLYFKTNLGWIVHQSQFFRISWHEPWSFLSSPSAVSVFLQMSIYGQHICCSLAQSLSIPTRFQIFCLALKSHWELNLTYSYKLRSSYCPA